MSFPIPCTWHIISSIRLHWGTSIWWTRLFHCLPIFCPMKSLLVPSAINQSLIFYDINYVTYSGPPSAETRSASPAPIYTRDTRLGLDCITSTQAGGGHTLIDQCGWFVVSSQCSLYLQPWLLSILRSKDLMLYISSAEVKIFFYDLTSFSWSFRDQFGRRGQRVCVPVSTPQAVFWLPRRDPHADAEACHPPAHHFKHDNR